MIGRSARFVVLCLVGFAAVAPAASGSTAYVSDTGVLVVMANAGEKNYVTVSDPGVTIEVGDTAGIVPGAGCEAMTDTKVRCPGFEPVGVGKTLITLLDGDDFYHEQSELFQDDVDAGPGNDEVYGSRETDVIRGGDGNDTLHGGGADDTIYGDAGDDTIKGSSENDTIDGGSGADLIEGDGDGFHDGSDTIESADGEVDRVSCGGGQDLVTADRADMVHATCDSVKIKDGPNPTPPDPIPGEPRISVTLPKAPSLATFLSSGFSFSAAFSEQVSFAAVLYVPRKAAKRLGLGRKDTRIAQGGGTAGPGEASAKLTKRFMKSRLKALLREGGSPIPVIFQAVAQDADGNLVEIKRKSRLRR